MDKSIYENSILPKAASAAEPFILPKKRYMKECLEEQRILSTKSDGVTCPVSSLSGGNAQKVVMGKWIHMGISLLILSDPAKGVDVGAKKDLYDFVRKLVDERGISVLLYASDNEELIDNCDRVLVMHEGRFAGELEGTDITDEKLIELSMRGAHAAEGGGRG